MIALVFPGQGSQSVGMGRKIAEAFPQADQVFNLANETLGWDIKKLCFEGPAEKLNQTEFTQPAILTASLAVFAALKEKLHTTPRYVAGHSLGEYTAITAAGGLSFQSAVRLVSKRGEAMQKAVPEGKGAMAAVLGMNRADVELICKEASRDGIVSPANFNSLEQTVIAGEKGAVERASREAMTKGAKKVIPLAVSVPSHCLLMEPAARALEKEFAITEFHDLKIGLINNVEAKELTAHDAIRASLIRQVTSPLLWVDTILYLVGKGVKIFVEVGPGRVLSGLIKRIDRQLEVLSVEDPESLEKTMTRLAELGA